MSRELWKCIKDFEGYKVSDKGNVSRKDESGMYVPANMYLDKKGYPLVNLCRIESGKRRYYIRSVSRLVADAFVRNDVDGLIVKHKNNVISDNSAENLRWIKAKRRDY